MYLKKLQATQLRFFILLIVFLGAISSTNAQLTTTRKGNYASMTYLVDSVLLGKGIKATNITWTNMDTAFGFFNGKSSNIGMDSGIIMCNGGIGLAEGPNKKGNDKSDGTYTTYNYSTTDGWPNANTYEDQDLADLIPVALNKTYSCFILQFDFIAPSDSIQFQYVFGSNEEPCFWNDTYFDDFGFFLSGPGIAGPFSNSAINLAVLPGTTTPVAINNVNCSTNSAYYICNSPPSTSGSNCAVACTTCPANSAGTTVGYGGFTTVLTAKAKLECGQKYHIKLGVANIGNGKFDSGVFLKGGSFKPNSTPMTVTPPSTTTCAGNPVILTGSNATSYTWSPASSLNNSTGTSVTATPTTTTTYTVIGTISTGCTDTSKVTITVPANPTLSVTPSAPAICAGGSVNITASGASTYTWTPSGGLSCTSCASITANPATTTKYYVTGTAADGCINKDSVTITVAAVLPVTASSASPTVCSADSVLLTANGASSFSWSPATGLACATCANTMAASANTTYTVTGTSSGCSNTATVTIASIPSPTVTATANTAGTCLGIADTLKAAGAITYTWSPSATLSSSTGTPVAATPTVPTKYVVTGTAANGCIAKDSVTISINPSPTVSIKNSSPSFICSGTTDTLTASGATSYVWSPASLLNTTTGPQVLTTPTVTTTYTVIGTNASGCNDTVPITITVVTTPTITVTPASPGICPGDSVLLVASGASTYSWSPTLGIDSLNIDSVEAKPASNTTYTVTGFAGGCSAKDSVTISVGKLVVSASSVSSILCSGNSTNMTASGAATYTWSPGNTLNDSITATVTATPTTTTTYTVTGTSGAGCNADTTITITVNPTPTLTLKADSGLICFGTGGTIVIAGGAATYNWNPSGSVACNTCDTTNANPNSTTVFTVTGTSASGCPATDTMTISVDKPVISAKTSSAAICNGANDTITASGGVTYIWSPATALNTTNGNQVIANPGADTTYKVVGIDALGCKDSATAFVKVNQNPVVTATASDSSICSGNKTNLSGSGAGSYVWSPSSSVSCNTCANTSADPTSSTTYTLVGKNGAGCADTAMVPITVNISPVIKITPPSGDTLCPNQTITMTASGGTTYVWFPSTGLNKTTGSSVIASAPNPGPITYTIIGTNGVCSDSDKTTLYSYPKFNVSMGPDSICKGQQAQVSVSVTGGKSGYNYNWTNANPALPNGPGPYNVNPTTPAYYVCNVTDGCGTMLTDSMLVYTRPVPVAAFTATPNSIMGGEYVSFVNTSTGATSYYWSLGTGYSTSDSFPYYQYEIPGTYTVYLVAVNQFGCSDTAQDTIDVKGGIFVPNVFTPNGDGQNDVFHVTAGGMKTYYIEIFNRWGEKVFDADSPNIDWTGRSTSGVQESDGIYYYILKATDYSNKNYNLNGYLQLIR